MSTLSSSSPPPSVDAPSTLAVETTTISTALALPPPTNPAPAGLLRCPNEILAQIFGYLELLEGTQRSASDDLARVRLICWRLEAESTRLHFSELDVEIGLRTADGLALLVRSPRICSAVNEMRLDVGNGVYAIASRGFALQSEVELAGAAHAKRLDDLLYLEYGLERMSEGEPDDEQY